MFFQFFIVTMDDAHLAVIHLVGHRSTAGAEHATVEIPVIHAQHHAAYIFIVVLAFPYAGIGALLDEWLENIIRIKN